mmetsp:Transcript_39188/g.71343  ORF Transcript_39188/g.71343 Transcript_39188/m.71343 type:complete len:331 (-) Transcript_39188:152-1144(-)
MPRAAQSPFSRRSSRSTATVLGVVAALCVAKFIAGAFVMATRSASIATAPGLRTASRLPRAATKDKDVSSLKADLMSLLDDDELAKEVLRPEGKPIRGRVDELIVQVERQNPTEEPVFSESLDGEWMVKYAGSYAPGLLSSPTRELALFLYGGGFSLGAALNSFSSGVWGDATGLKVMAQRVSIIDGRTVDAFADIEAFGQTQTLSYMAELTPLSGARMSEEVTTLELPSPLGMVSPPLEIRRQILVTYLDSDLMIVRDESGVPEVLVRQDMGFMPEEELEAEEDLEEDSNSSSLESNETAEEEDTKEDTKKDKKDKKDKKEKKEKKNKK